MKNFFAISVLFLLILGCKPTTENNPVQNVEAEKAAILSIMSTQEADWNKGDIPAFMKGYWNSPEMTFVGKTSVTRGWDATLKRYLTNYPDKAAMGKLKFDVVELKPLSSEIYHMIGKYTLQVGDTFPSGHFTLLWKNLDGEWKIVLDHSS